MPYTGIKLNLAIQFEEEYVGVFVFFVFVVTFLFSPFKHDYAQTYRFFTFIFCLKEMLFSCCMQLFNVGINDSRFLCTHFDYRSKSVAEFVAICKCICWKRVNDIQVVPTVGMGTQCDKNNGAI